MGMFEKKVKELVEKMESGFISPSDKAKLKENNLILDSKEFKISKKVADNWIEEFMSEQKKKGVVKTPHPTITIIGALAATGKSTISSKLKDYYKNNGGLFHIDADAIRDAHPRSKELFKKGELAYELATRWFSLYIRFKLIEKSSEGYNSSIEQTFNSPQNVEDVIAICDEKKLKVKIIAIIAQQYYAYRSGIQRVYDTHADKDKLTRSLLRTYKEYEQEVPNIVKTIGLCLENQSVMLMDIYYRFHDKPRFAIFREKKKLLMENQKGKNEEVNIEQIKEVVMSKFTRTIEKTEREVCIDICKTCLAESEKLEFDQTTIQYIEMFVEFLEKVEPSEDAVDINDQRRSCMI